jgi:flagellar export protein FliJ
MARFQFRLQGLLALREADRDEKRSQLAQAWEAAEKLRGEAERMDQELADLRALARQAAAGAVDVDRLVETHRYELVLRAQQKTLVGQRQLVDAEVEKRRLALVAADQDVRVLEKLREAQLERHRKAEERVEMKRLDEVAGRRAAARSRTDD